MNTKFISYQFPATGGSAVRSDPDRWSDIKNVLDFGADPTNNNDSAAAFQGAINATAGSNRGTIVVPAGTYKINSAVKLYTGAGNLLIKGVGANSSKILSTFNGFVFDQLSDPYSDAMNNCVIEGLQIQNQYAGGNYTQAAGASWVLNAATITMSGSNPGVSGTILLYDQSTSQQSQFVGICTVSWPTLTVTGGGAAIASAGSADNMLLVQAYAAAASWSNSASSINMGTTPGANVPVQCLAYDYTYLNNNFGVFKAQGVGVGTWSGTSFTFSGGSAAGHASNGSADLLVFSPIAGAIRFSSGVTGEIRDCSLTGFHCITTNEDYIPSNVTQSGQGLSSFSCIIQNCTFSPPGAAAQGSWGCTAIQITENCLALSNDLSGFWCGIRIWGHGSSVIGGRYEVNNYGIIVGSPTNTSNNVSSGSVFFGFSMESNIVAILDTGGSAHLYGGLTILGANANNLQYGMILQGADTTVIASTVSGNYHGGNAIYIADPGSTATNVSFISVEASNLNDSTKNWRLPAQAWTTQFMNCNNPAVTYTFANLPTGSSSPSPVEGMEFNITTLLSSQASFGITISSTTGSSSTHGKVRFNGTNWTVCGI